MDFVPAVGSWDAADSASEGRIIRRREVEGGKERMKGMVLRDFRREM